MSAATGSAVTRGLSRFALGVAIALVISACAGSAPGTTTTGASASGALAANQVLKFGTSSPDLNTGFDPGTWIGGEAAIARSIFSFLVRVDRSKGIDKIVPDLAESWTTSTDGKVWTFKIRKGVSFHRGYGDATADDVVYTLQRAQLKESVNSAVQLAGLTEIKALDPNTVQITLKAPDPFLLEKFADIGTVYLPILSKKFMSENDPQWAFKPVGSGPFAFQDYRPKDRVVLVRNDSYYAGKPALSQIEFYFVPDLAARLLALEKGDLNMISLQGAAPAQISQLTNKSYKYVTALAYTAYLELPVDTAPFKDIRVRQAFAHGIDFKAISDFFAPISVPYEAPLRAWQPNLPAYAAVKGSLPDYKYDPQMTRKLLADAGYPNGIKETLTYGSPPAADELSIIQAQLKSAGIDLELKLVEQGTFFTNAPKGDYRLTWFTTGRSIEVELPQLVFVTGAKYNFARYSNAQVDQWTTQAAAEMDPAKRTALMGQVLKQLMQDLAFIPYLTRPAGGTAMIAPTVDMGYDFNVVIDNRDPIITHQTRILAKAP